MGELPEAVGFSPPGGRPGEGCHGRPFTSDEGILRWAQVHSLRHRYYGNAPDVGRERAEHPAGSYNQKWRLCPSRPPPYNRSGCRWRR